MKRKILLIIKVLLLLLFSFMWFLLVQAEFEMLTKPYLRAQCPVVQGSACVYFGGVILSIIALFIFALSYSIYKHFKQKKL